MNCIRLAVVNVYKASPSKQVFHVLFYNLFNNRNPIYNLSTAVKRTEQNRTELSFLPVYSEIVVPFPFLANWKDFLTGPYFIMHTPLVLKEQ